MSETTQTTPPAKLYAALAAAQKVAEAVGKDARNTFHGYSYASAEAIIAEARAALSAHGLAVFTASIDRDESQREHKWGPWTNPKTGVETQEIDVPRRIRCRYLLVHESGEALAFESTTPVIPENGRPEDKAEFGSRTENLGYALRDLLLLPRVQEETLPSARNDQGYEGPKRGAEQPPKATAPAAAAPAGPTSSTAPVADPERAETLKKVRDIVGKDLQWEDKRARALVVELFGVDTTTKLSKPQASVLLQLVLAATVSEDAYKSALEKARLETPALFAPAKGAAA